MSFFFVIKEGFAGFFRSKMQTVITVAVSFISLLLLSIFCTVTISFFDVIKEIRSQVEVEVFLGESVAEQAVPAVQREVTALAGVRDVRYVSKSQAARIFRSEFGEDIVGILGSNPLPRSLKVKLQPDYTSPEEVGRIVPEIRRIVADSDIRYNQAFLGQIEENVRLFTLVTGGIGIFIALTTIALTGSTIRLAMYSRRETIRTMKLVGATWWLIGTPYIIEGALQGLLAGGLAAGTLYLLFDQLLQNYEPQLFRIVEPSALMVYPAAAALGLLLGLVGSTMSVNKYLRLASRQR